MDDDDGLEVVRGILTALILGLLILTGIVTVVLVVG
jgi:hypothetical protein